MIKAIFFDNDGVLSDIGLKTTIPKQYAKEYNISSEDFYAAIHEHQAWKDFTLGLITEAEYFKVCAEHLTTGKFNSERFKELLDKYTFPNLSMIKFIKNELVGKYKLEVISNSPKEWFDRFLQRTNLYDIIEIKLASGYVHLRKPDKKIFELAIKEAGIKPEECIYIDDRPERIDGAIELGIKIVIFDGNVKHLKEQINNLGSVIYE